MPRKRALSPSNHIEDFEDDFDDENSSNGSKNNLPVQRNAANARERARMRVLSSAFCRLKTKLPWVPADTKLSKLDTLRLATIYIQQLRTSLTTGKDSYPPPYEGSRIESSPSSNSSQTSMVWPFSFQQQQQQQQQQPPQQLQQQPQEQQQPHQQPQVSNYHEHGQITPQHSTVPSECRSIQNTNYWYERHFSQNTRFEYNVSAISADTEAHHKFFDHTRHIVNNNTIHTPHAEHS